MAYFNYHAKIKNKIRNGEMVNAEFVDKYHKISPALIITFSDGFIAPIRESHFADYIYLINNLDKFTNSNKKDS